MAALRRLALASFALALSIASAESQPIQSLRFIGAATIPNDATVNGQLIGGLSGLDYDPAHGDFIVISDDRSDHAPARFYTVKLTFSYDRLFRADATKVTDFLQENGQPYPNTKTGGEVPDPESIRLDPQNGDVWWTSEGDRTRNLDPFLRVVDPAGKEAEKITTPPMFDVHPDKESGGRDNLTFEALTFAPDGKTLWLGMEAPIYEDGPVASVSAGAITRFTHMDRDGKVLKQVAYPLDAIPAAPGLGKAADNGVSDFLADDANHLIAIERSGVEAADNSYKDYIRLYEADITGASDVYALNALKDARYVPVQKRLLLDLDKADIGYVDNIEGISWGPKLSDGNDTLILVSDNNFNRYQQTQFLAFEVVR